MAKRRYAVKRSVFKKVDRYFHPFTRDEGREKVWLEGDFVIGEYLMDMKDTYGNSCPLLRVEEAEFSNPVTDKDGNQISNSSLEGEKLQLNNTGTLEHAFYTDENSPNHGETVKITYLGIEKLTKGEWKGKKSHNIEVEVLEEVIDSEVSEEEMGNQEVF